MTNPTFPNVPAASFNDGEVWTPTLAYIALSPTIFDGQTTFYNHSIKIPDEWLSDDPEMVKDYVFRLQDPFKVTVSSGTIVTHSAGFLIGTDGELVEKASAGVLLPADGVIYIGFDANNTIFALEKPPVVRCLIAKVTTVNGSVTEIVDLRFTSHKRVMPQAATIKSFGGVSSVDETATGSSVYSGFYYFRNFTVPSSTNCQVDQYAKFFCSGDVTIEGNIVVNPVNNGAAPNTFFVNSNSQGNIPGTGLGSQGDAYNWAIQPFGSGGGIGEIASSVTALGGDPNTSNQASGLANLGDGGGNGGGGIWIECAGTVRINGTITADGQDGNAVSGAGDVVIVGNGGGSGGTIIITSLIEIDAIGATFNARGGDGADSYIAPTTAIDWQLGGGFGGGGGQVVLMAPSINTAFADFNLEGGRCANPISSNSFWTLYNASINQWRILKTYNDSALANSIGGGNGGIAGFRTISSDTFYDYLTLTHGADGIVTFNNFIPLG